MAKPTVVTDATFETEVLRAKTPVLVDFGAEWCMPCRVIAPIVADLAQEYGEDLKVVKLDVDTNPQTPATYRIRSIPTLLLILRGEVVDRIVGAAPKALLKQRIEEVLRKEEASRGVAM